MAVLLVSIGSTAFDGAKEGSLFNDAVPHVQDFFEGLGLRRARRSSGASCSGS